MPAATIPRGIQWENRLGGFGATTIARLSAHVTIDGARAELTQLGRRLRGTYGNAIAAPEVRALSEATVGSVRQRLWLLMAAVIFVLLIAAANVGNLMMVAHEQRRRELAVRVALGAARADILRLLSIEAVVIGLCGGVAGVVLANASVGSSVRLLPIGLPAIAIARIHVDALVALWGLVLAVGTTVLFGVVPEWRASAGDHFGALKSGARSLGGAGRHVREALVITEVALAVVLLVAGGLMVHSLLQLLRVDKGFRTDNVMIARFTPSPENADARARRLTFNQLALDRVAAVPGVQEVALGLSLPLSNGAWVASAHPEGEPVRDETARPMLFNVVSPGYFAALGVPLLRGRTFTRADREGAPMVAMIDRGHRRAVLAESGCLRQATDCRT